MFGRVLDINYDKINNLCKVFGISGAKKIKEAIDNDAEFRNLYLTDNEIKQTLNYAMKLEGMPRNISTHACRSCNYQKSS